MSEFDKYIVQGEPDKRAKANAWQTAIGLQDVDGLKPSEYIIKTAVQHIAGDITIDQVKDMLGTYYEQRHASDTKSGIAFATISRSSVVANASSVILPLNNAKSSEIIS